VSLVYWACQDQSQGKETLNILVTNGAKWTKDWKIDNTTFLQKAAKEGHLEGVKTIMAKGYFEDDERITVQNLVEVQTEKPEAKDDWKRILEIIKDKVPSNWKESIREIYYVDKISKESSSVTDIIIYESDGRTNIIQTAVTMLLSPTSLYQTVSDCLHRPGCGVSEV